MKISFDSAHAVAPVPSVTIIVFETTELPGNESINDEARLAGSLTSDAKRTAKSSAAGRASQAAIAGAQSRG